MTASDSVIYVAAQINRIGQAQGNPKVIQGAKWNIASRINLFGSVELKDELTPDQINLVDEYISKFKATQGGREAIASSSRTP
jgi:hypothetical protein